MKCAAARQLQEARDTARLKQLKDDEKIKKMIWEAQGARENASYELVPKIRQDAEQKVSEYRKQVHEVRSARDKQEANREVTREREEKMHAAAMRAVKKDALDEREKLTADFKHQLATLEQKEAEIQKSLAPAREKTAKAQEKLKRRQTRNTLQKE